MELFVIIPQFVIGYFQCRLDRLNLLPGTGISDSKAQRAGDGESKVEVLLHPVRNGYLIHPQDTNRLLFIQNLYDKPVFSGGDGILRSQDREKFSFFLSFIRTGRKEITRTLRKNGKIEGPAGSKQRLTGHDDPRDHLFLLAHPCDVAEKRHHCHLPCLGFECCAQFLAP